MLGTQPLLRRRIHDPGKKGSNHTPRHRTRRGARFGLTGADATSKAHATQKGMLALRRPVAVRVGCMTLRME